MEHVVQRDLGAFRLTLVSEAEWLYPAEPVFTGGSPEDLRREVGADERGYNPAAGNLLLIQTPEATILVDAGLGDADPPMGPPALEARWRTRLASALASLGLSPSDVTHVAFTHPHGDHIVGATVAAGDREVPRFPRARYLLPRLEWAALDLSRSAYQLHLVPLREAAVLDLVDLPHRVAPGVEMLWTPGHTPGHAVVRVESGGQVAYFLGDLFHHYAELRHLEWGARSVEQAAQLAASRLSIGEAAIRENALLAISHSVEVQFVRLSRTPEGIAWSPA